MSPIDFLVLLIIWLKKAFTSWAEDHSLAHIIRIAAFAVRNHWLFLAQDPRAISYVSLEYLSFHLIHTFDRLDIPLVQQTIQLCTFLAHILAVRQIPFAELVHEVLHLIPSLNHLQCRIMVIDSFNCGRIFLIIVISSIYVCIGVKVIEVVLVVFPLLQAV